MIWERNFFNRKLNPAGDSISHYVETSLRPAEVGVTYRRKVRLDGDRLFISKHATEDGVPRHRVLTWRRAQVVHGLALTPASSMRGFLHGVHASRPKGNVRRSGGRAGRSGALGHLLG